MTRTRRTLFVLALLGAGIAAFSMLGAAQHTGGNGTSPDSKDPAKNGAKDTSRGVVCLGTADIDADQIAVFPDNFPPSTYPIRIMSVKKKEGDKVAKGDVIAILDDVIPKKMVEKAEAGVGVARANLEKAKKAVEGHKSLIQAQEENVSAKEYEVSTKQAALPLLKKEADKGVVGRAEEYKATLEAIKALEKARDAETARLNGLKAVPPTDQVDAARAAVTVAEVDLDLANELLRQVVYRSPVDGTIHRSALYEGMIFGPQMRKEPIVIQPNGKLFIRAEVNQEYANRVILNQKATIVDYSNTSITWKGKITKVADHFTPKRNNNSSGVELFSSGDDPILEVTIELEDAKNPVIRQGQRVRVYIGTE